MIVSMAITTYCQVFENYELLENIILYLPLRQVFVARRISTYFEGIFNRSKPVRRALFLAPATPQHLRHFEIAESVGGGWSAGRPSVAIRPVLNPFAEAYAQPPLRTCSATKADRS